MAINGALQTVDSLATPQQEAVLTVSDTGRGLPIHDSHRLFDPFFSTKETGVGLGLAMCSRIVEAHGGRISDADEPHSGAVFTVHLPLMTADCNSILAR